MCAYRNVRRSKASNVRTNRGTASLKSHVRQRLSGSQSKNLRLVGSISAIMIIISGLLFLLYYFLVFGSLSLFRKDFLIMLLPVGIIIISIIWQAFLMYVLFHSGGEHLEKMEQITSQNSRLIEMIAEKIDFDVEQAEIAEENAKSSQIQGSCPFCKHPVLLSHREIHTCSKCGNKFQA